MVKLDKADWLIEDCAALDELAGGRGFVILKEDAEHGLFAMLEAAETALINDDPRDIAQTAKNQARVKLIKEIIALPDKLHRAYVDKLNES